MTYDEFLTLYNEAFESQPAEVKELVGFQGNYMNDENVQMLKNLLTEENDQYRTYTHS